MTPWRLSLNKGWVPFKIFWPGLGQLLLGSENFPSRSRIIQFLPSLRIKNILFGSKNTWVKDRSASYLLRVKSVFRSIRPQGPKKGHRERMEQKSKLVWHQSWIFWGLYSSQLSQRSSLVKWTLSCHKERGRSEGNPGLARWCLLLLIISQKKLSWWLTVLIDDP